MDTTTTSSSSSSHPIMSESMRGCGLFVKIDKELLRTKLLVPEYLRLAMRDAIYDQNVSAAVEKHSVRKDAAANAAAAAVPSRVVVAPECPLFVFVNSKSGGRHGPVLKERLQHLISDEQVFDLQDVAPCKFVQYGLACLEKLADLGDECARETRERLRIMVAGGDGTVGWVLGCLGELNRQGRFPIPPVGIIPLGTGNDLSRTFGWGGSFPLAWKSAVKGALQRAITGPICHLDSWQVVLSMPSGKAVKLPHCMKPTEECNLDQGLEIEGALPEKSTCYEGVFYSYFSIGMDAQVAYGFHNLRNEKPHIAQSPIANKLIYTSYSCTQGWFFTPCSSDPGLRGLKNILRMHVKKVNCSDWEQILVPKSVRAIVLLNLQNYGSGRNPWGNLSPKYMEKRGFVEAHADDGLLEIFGLKQGWHGSFVMVKLISAKHIAQAAAVRLEVRGGEWKGAYMQMDGEPWKQPLSKDSTFVEIKRVPFQSLMIHGD